MESARQWLSNYGLNDKEIEIYLAIAQHTDSKATDIQRHTGFVRTTVYYGLNQLKAHGLISENVQNNVRTFRANDASVFRNRIQQTIEDEQARLSQVSVIEDYLSSIKQDQTTESYVSRYEGSRSIKLAIEAALRCNSRTWHVLAARDNFLFHMPKTYQKYYLSERERRGITAKTLWEPIESSGVSLKDAAFRSPRRLPPTFAGTFKSLIIIYDDTVLIIDPYDQKTAHSIHSQTTADLMRMMFMAIWSNADNI